MLCEKKWVLLLLVVDWEFYIYLIKGRNIIMNFCVNLIVLLDKYLVKCFFWVCFRGILVFELKEWGK